MSEPVVRADPKPAANVASGVDWHEVATAIRKLKGEWGMVPGEFNPSVAGHMRRGRYPAIDPDEFEVTSRQVTPGERRANIYLRWKGGE